MTWPRPSLWLLLLGLGSGCSGARAKGPEAPSPPALAGAEAPSTVEEPSPRPQASEGEETRSERGAQAEQGEPGGSMIELAVPGFEPSLVVVPRGSDRRPLMVAAHGAWDRADWLCSAMAQVVRDRGFVLCPRGKRVSALQPGPAALYYYPTHLFLEREIEAALGAMREAFGARLDAERAVYAGFSQGAIMGSLVVVRSPARFPRAMLIEGSYGQGQWGAAMAQMFRRGGGERVLLACGGWFCGGQARESAMALERAGVEARLVVASGGHTYGGPVALAVQGSFDWLVEGDPRWR